MDTIPSETRISKPSPVTESADIGLSGKTLGDFKVCRCLGRGGMGQVYLAEQISLKREVALKTLRPDLAANMDSLRRFETEARAVAKATHANIVQIYVIGKETLDDRIIHFLALEYVDGRNLRDFMEKNGSPSVLIGLSIMHQVAAALQRASELGIIHRDIKPENILITRQNEVKVADFGLARCFADSAPSASMTQSNVTMGTPLYMSPEQVELRPVDPRSDIYSFGVTCYHMFAGQPPFRGKSPFEIAAQHVQKEPPQLHEARPDLPFELCALIHRMMAKNPEERPQTSREIVREVFRLRDLVLGGSLSGLNLDSSAGSQPIEPAANSGPKVMRQPSWFQWSWTRGIIATLVALGIGFWASIQFLSSQSHRQPGSDLVLGEVTSANPTAFDEQEKKLLKQFQEHNNIESALALGVLYFQKNKLKEAEALFQPLTNHNHREFVEVGKLGIAMVEAFRAQPNESTRLFKEVLVPKDKVLAPKDKGFKDKHSTRDESRKLWKGDLVWMEMIAWALYHNKENMQAGRFPAELEPWLRPRPPTAKMASAL